MDDHFKIFVDQLREGREHNFEDVLSPDFLDIHESDLKFESPIRLEGEAYLADTELVIHWNIQAEAIMSCSICNEPVIVPINIQNFYASEALENITNSIYCFKDLLREAILIEVPAFVECNQGHCVKRKEFNKYLKEPSNSSEEEEGYHPFADLDWKP